MALAALVHSGTRDAEQAVRRRLLPQGPFSLPLR